MRTTLAIVTVAVALPLATAHAQRDQEVALIQPPPDARLVGSSTVDEIRAFPELYSRSPAVDGQPAKEKLVGVEGVDRVFETHRSYAATVAYFDARFRRGGYRTQARVETATATAWSVKRPDGTVAQAAVRDTTPTSIELTEVTTESPGLNVR